MPSPEATDAAYGRLTKRAKTQRQVWKIDHIYQPEACAEHLNELSRQDAMIFEVQEVEGDWFMVTWYRWED